MFILNERSSEKASLSQCSMPVADRRREPEDTGPKDQAMPKIAHIEASANGGAAKLTKVASHATDRGADAARESMQGVQRAAGAMSGLQQETLRQSTEGTKELGQLFVQLFNEQVRHNLQVATAFGRAVNWGEVVKAQSDFVRGSFERMNQLSGRYREIVQAGMKAMASTART